MVETRRSVKKPRAADEAQGQSAPANLESRACRPGCFHAAVAHEGGACRDARDARRKWYGDVGAEREYVGCPKIAPKWAFVSL